jgi:hypothetical protein
MLERTDADTFQFRLAGTKLCEHFASELRGTNFLDGWEEQDRIVLEDVLAAICSQGSVAVLRLEASAGGQHRVEMEAILLPLLHNGDSIGRIIGAMSATSAPHWLSSERLSSRRLLRHELIWPDGRPHSLVERAAMPSPFQPGAADARRSSKGERPQFRVLEGGRALSKHDKR